jgi:DNA-binding PadR family transcriptional regulator
MAFLLNNQDHEFYGLEIAQATKLAAGTLYPILMRLEKWGWIEGTWEDIDPKVEGRRPRRYYHLTAQGMTAGKREVDSYLQPILNAAGVQI